MNSEQKPEVERDEFDEIFDEASATVAFCRTAAHALEILTQAWGTMHGGAE